MGNEQLFLWAALLIYLAAGCLAIVSQIFQKKSEHIILLLMSAGLVLQTLSISLRWERLGHGPFNTMFEILSSNIWSLMLFFILVYWRIEKIRAIASIVMPVIFIMLAWIVMTPAHDSYLPATYNTIWLYVHIGFGKIFLGSLLIAAALSFVILFRWAELWEKFLSVLPASKALEELAYRFILLGLIFDSLMLLAGAIWAQEAWGRYWSWDQLENWSFASWLSLVFVVHLKITFKLPQAVAATLAIVIFIISFLTFFGVPFLSQVPHKGVI
jgi:ABC-type transport system involved in cytochrome c biogenesis permease subunit